MRFESAIVSPCVCICPLRFFGVDRQIYAFRTIASRRGYLLEVALVIVVAFRLEIFRSKAWMKRHALVGEKFSVRHGSSLWVIQLRR